MFAVINQERIILGAYITEKNVTNKHLRRFRACQFFNWGTQALKAVEIAHESFVLGRKSNGFQQLFSGDLKFLLIRGFALENAFEEGLKLWPGFVRRDLMFVLRQQFGRAKIFQQVELGFSDQIKSILVGIFFFGFL